MSTNARGVAKLIFDKWPETNTYMTRKTSSLLGTIDVFDGPKVINMYAQRYPGGPSSEVDTVQQRLNAFMDCLKIAETTVLSSSAPAFETISFPYGIGCGLAKGNWFEYMGLLHDSFERVKQLHPLVQYRIVRL